MQSTHKRMSRIKSRSLFSPCLFALGLILLGLRVPTPFCCAIASPFHGIWLASLWNPWASSDSIKPFATPLGTPSSQRSIWESFHINTLPLIQEQWETGRIHDGWFCCRATSATAIPDCTSSIIKLKTYASQVKLPFCRTSSSWPRANGRLERIPFKWVCTIVVLLWV